MKPNEAMAKRVMSREPVARVETQPSDPKGGPAHRNQGDAQYKYKHVTGTVPGTK